MNNENAALVDLFDPIDWDDETDRAIQRYIDTNEDRGFPGLKGHWYTGGPYNVTAEERERIKERVRRGYSDKIIHLNIWEITEPRRYAAWKKRKMEEYRNSQHGKKKQWLYKYSSRAKKNGIIYNLKASDVWIPQKCPVLGIDLDFTDGDRATTPALGRFVAERGYTPDNVYVISTAANRGMASMGMDELQRAFVQIMLEREIVACLNLKISEPESA